MWICFSFDGGFSVQEAGSCLSLILGWHSRVTNTKVESRTVMLPICGFVELRVNDVAPGAERT